MLLSPLSFRAKALAQRLEGWDLKASRLSFSDVYGFEVVDLFRLLERALAQPPMPEVEEGELKPLETEPWLYASEYQDLRSGADEKD